MDVATVLGDVVVDKGHRFSAHVLVPQVHALNGQRACLPGSDDEGAGAGASLTCSSAALGSAVPQRPDGEASSRGHDDEQRPGHDVGTHRQPTIEGQGEEEITADRADDGRVENPQRLRHRGVAPQTVVHLEGGEDSHVDDPEHADGQEAAGRACGGRPLRGPPRRAEQSHIGGQEVDDHQSEGLEPAQGGARPQRVAVRRLHGGGARCPGTAGGGSPLFFEGSCG